MLNTIALNGNGGKGFRLGTRAGAHRAVDSILAWERTHDTLAGGSGSDPHGWRNALNYYGWGSGALAASSRVYEDLAFTSYDRAVKNAIRQLIRTRKPVGILAWQGRHAQFITGYAGLSGKPFAKDGAGRYRNDFTVDAVFLSDPLKADGWVNARIGYAELKSSSNARLRFAPYAETDSPYDDPYTSGKLPGPRRVARPLGDHRPAALGRESRKSRHIVRSGPLRSRFDAVPVKVSAETDASAARQGHLSRRLHRLP